MTMHGRDTFSYHRTPWRNRQQLGPQPGNSNLRNLLLASGSLTRHLRQRCGEALDLEIIAQKWQYPWQEEQLLLGLSTGRYALIREVLMACRETPWLYARTLLPPEALRGAARRFTTIGQRPLGALLFGAPGRLRIRSVKREYARLPAASRISRRLTSLLPESRTGELWARRTLYQTRSMHFAIIEVFLPPAWEEPVS